MHTWLCDNLPAPHSQRPRPVRERNALTVAAGLSWDGFSSCSLGDRHVPTARMCVQPAPRILWQKGKNTLRSRSRSSEPLLTFGSGSAASCEGQKQEPLQQQVPGLLLVLQGSSQQAHGTVPLLWHYRDGHGEVPLSQLLNRLQQILLRDFLRGISSIHHLPQLRRFSWASSHALKWWRNTSCQ